jgi:hypothetical protein
VKELLRERLPFLFDQEDSICIKKRSDSSDDILHSLRRLREENHKQEIDFYLNSWDSITEEVASSIVATFRNLLVEGARVE